MFRVSCSEQQKHRDSIMLTQPVTPAGGKATMRMMVFDERGENVMKPEETPSAGRSDSELARSQLRVLKSDDLLCGEKVVIIMHRGEVYRLRETRNGKLILSK